MIFSNKEKTRIKEKYGPWALVTGASSGIGKELAQRLAETGLHLVLTARRKALLQELSSALGQEYGIETRVIEADIAEQKGIDTIITQSNALDIGLVVLAAGFGTSGEFFKSAVENEQSMLRVNCEALMLMSHHFSGIFKVKQGGGLILLSSIVGFHGAPYMAHYAATKAYVQSLGEGLAHELKPYGVDVLNVAPGPVQSGFEKRAAVNMELAMNTSEIGVPILKALGRKSTVFPGKISKLMTYSSRIFPRWAKVKMTKVVMKRMTKNQ